MLNEPNKAVLFHYICQLLPHEAQAEFDRIAAASLDGGKTNSEVYQYSDTIKVACIEE